MMRKIASVRKMMRKIAVMRKMMRKIVFMRKMMRKMKISTSKGEYSRSTTAQDIRISSTGTKYLLLVQLKHFLSELGPIRFRRNHAKC